MKIFIEVPSKKLSPTITMKVVMNFILKEKKKKSEKKIKIKKKEKKRKEKKREKNQSQRGQRK